MKKGFVYIITNKNNNVLYTGITSELKNRIEKHKKKFYPNSFASKYNCNKLVYYEELPIILDAIAREKQIKGGSRKKKIDLIESINPEWDDLFDQL